MRLALWTFLALSIVAAEARAQEFPRQPLKMVVPYAAGGLPDTMTRIVGARLAEQVGQQVIVENRGGAGGISGTEAAAKAPADGYTLLVADVGQVAINPHLFPKLPYDPPKDFVPVTLVASQPNVLAVHPSLPAKTVRELIAIAKARPGQLQVLNWRDLA